MLHTQNVNTHCTITKTWPQVLTVFSFALRQKITEKTNYLFYKCLLHHCSLTCVKCFNVICRSDAPISLLVKFLHSCVLFFVRCVFLSPCCYLDSQTDFKLECSKLNIISKRMYIFFMWQLNRNGAFILPGTESSLQKILID